MTDCAPLAAPAATVTAPFFTVATSVLEEAQVMAVWQSMKVEAFFCGSFCAVRLMVRPTGTSPVWPVLSVPSWRIFTLVGAVKSS